MLEGLSEFAASFARPLFEAFPWLREHAEVHPHPEADAGSLLIEYSPPPVRENCGLWISTNDEEVTIGFGLFHTHFEWPRDEADEFWEDPLEFLRALIEERILIEDWTKGGKWSGSSFLEDGAEPDTDDMLEDNVVHVRSWSGAHDRIIEHPGHPGCSE